MLLYQVVNVQLHPQQTDRINFFLPTKQHFIYYLLYIQVDSLANNIAQRSNRIQFLILMVIGYDHQEQNKIYAQGDVSVQHKSFYDIQLVPIFHIYPPLQGYSIFKAYAIYLIRHVIHHQICLKQAMNLFCYQDQQQSQS